MSARAEVSPLTAPSPAETFLRLGRQAGLFWLDSSLQRPGDGRYSIIGCEPRWVFVAQGEEWRVERKAGPGEHGTGDPLAKLERLLEERRVAPAVEVSLPFYGGAVGWFSYDLGRRFETIDGEARADLEVPEIRLAWYDAAVVWDHEIGRIWAVGVGGERSAVEAMRELAAWIEAPPVVPAADEHGEGGNLVAASDLGRPEYLARVATIRERIARGEVYQANLVQRFSCALPATPAATYLRLREANPAPFALYQDAGDWAVLSSSPERFIEVSPDGRIRTCPIKGTRARGATVEEDAQRKAELAASEKERAELLMIVDLLRNDLGRVCRFGSIRVPRLHDLETFATVHHLVGEVTGELRPEVRLGALLRAVFPGGSISGAPKVSALQLIDRLEPHRRGICMGALGYVSAHGRMDLNIAIRTIVCHRGQAYFQVGAGIVWDSNPEAEYEETLAKARGLFQALGVREVAS